MPQMFPLYAVYLMILTSLLLLLSVIRLYWFSSELVSKEGSGFYIKTTKLNLAW